MSYASMARSLMGEVPKAPFALCKNKLNEALGNCYDATDWSFQTQQDGWLNPGTIASVGTVTVAPYSPTVVCDASATAALLLATAKGRPFLTELQFRSLPYALYNIVAYDDGQTAGQGNYPFATLTLDRNWMESISGSGITYIIYQAYFPVPVKDFRKFIEIRDTTNNQPVDFVHVSQDDLSSLDAQRLMFGPTDPTYAVPWGVDQRKSPDGTPYATYGYIVYEIWPHNLSWMPYSFSYKRRGPILDLPADTVPYPITEDCVSMRAKSLLYQWAEAQKGVKVDRGSGADFRFLTQQADKEWIGLLKQCRMADANLHRDFVTHPMPSGAGRSGDGYSTNTLGWLNVGDFRR